ncbi:pathogenesis-related protein 5-like [Sesamum indicum]|uniref:Pathogenesis-related protein 5-like n=1 Tax=Sesamum indicum TaxID=4182 RepID=A0A8M8V3C5_SESIN|nr:pathogenesis-related protein 5-like [Sesamum indicum]
MAAMQNHFLLLPLFFLGMVSSVMATVFTLQNSCSYTIWPGTLTGNGGAILGATLKGGGRGGAPPVSLVELTISSRGDKDFYDVSLVDGYNVGIGVRPSGGSGDCKYAGCVADVNANCPQELQVVDGGGAVVACRSACAAFNKPEYCCSGDHGTPETCGPTQYSLIFKNACPAAYSYAYDDQTSTFTCTGADYLITFCPTA